MRILCRSLATGQAAGSSRETTLKCVTYTGRSYPLNSSLAYTRTSAVRSGAGASRRGFSTLGPALEMLKPMRERKGESLFRRTRSSPRSVPPQDAKGIAG